LDLRALVEGLHSRGIETILSLIFGMKHHTPETLQKEMDHFVRLGGVYNQITIESPIPGTPNWEVFKRQGRIDTGFPLEHIHGYSAHYKHPHFQDGEVLERAKGFQRRIYEETGPAILKAIDVELEGYEHCLAHEDPVLRTHKAAYFHRSIKNNAPFLGVVRDRAESDKIRDRAREVLARYFSHFGAEDRLYEKKVARLIREYDACVERLALPGAKPIYFELTTQTTCYSGCETEELVWAEPVGV
jgi:hypothetical protein